ncbi:hypothetical protein GUJ93_ZPchr0003g16804 [Zizania palustris]|uniref:Uncharacterized protein n=1 Tax=Zizania palustris TaxID=103762 RepID=A0A8J5S0M1_ZIZPA|nr:hypothetical protein GUJ93_ZPchr0003g16804 [Zizania palustris]
MWDALAHTLPSRRLLEVVAEIGERVPDAVTPGVMPFVYAADEASSSIATAFPTTISALQGLLLPSCHSPVFLLMIQNQLDPGLPQLCHVHNCRGYCARGGIGCQHRRFYAPPSAGQGGRQATVDSHDGEDCHRCDTKHGGEILRAARLNTTVPLSLRMHHWCPKDASLSS